MAATSASTRRDLISAPGVAVYSGRTLEHSRGPAVIRRTVAKRRTARSAVDSREVPGTHDRPCARRRMDAASVSAA